MSVFEQRMYGFAGCLVAGFACMLLVPPKLFSYFCNFCSLGTDQCLKLDISLEIQYRIMIILLEIAFRNVIPTLP